MDKVEIERETLERAIAMLRRYASKEDMESAVSEELHAALAGSAVWRPIETAPIDENIIVAASPDWVGEARQDVEYPNREYALVWRWADGTDFHANHTPTHWRPKPKHPTPPQSIEGVI